MDGPTCWACGRTVRPTRRGPARDRVALLVAVAAWVLPALLLAPMAWEQTTTYNSGGFAFLGWYFLGAGYVLAGGLLSAVALAVAARRGTDAPSRGVRRWTMWLIGPLVVGTLVVGVFAVLGLLGLLMLRLSA